MTLTYAAERLTEGFRAPYSPRPKELARLRSKAHVSVAGVSNILDQELLNRLLANRKKTREDKQLAYEADARELFKKCDLAGIRHVRIMPLQAWDKLTDAAGLITMSPDKDSRVGIAMPIAEEEIKGLVAKRQLHIQNWGALAAFLSSIVSAVLVLVVAAFALSKSSPIVETAQIMSTLILTVVTGIGTFCGIRRVLVRDFDMRSFGWGSFTGAGRKKQEQRILRKLLRNGATAKKLLFPNLREGSGSKIQIVLPDAPEDVRAILLKASKADLQMHVRAVPEAIGFAEDPAVALTRSRADVYKATDIDNERKRSARLDPIIEVRYGLAVAVIAQYGDFPIEKQLIDKIADEDVRYLA